MKIVIPSKGRADTISTHLLLEEAGLAYTIVVHTEQEMLDYLKNPTVSPENIVFSNAPAGVSNQRQWIQENLVEKDEWYLSLDDNIKGFQAVPESHYEQEELPVKDKEQAQAMKALYETPCSMERFMEICEEMIAKGEREKIYYMGFGTTGNFFFRPRKYRYVGFVITKAFIAKNTGISFYFEPQVKEDYAFTAENLLRYGKVLINGFVYPVAGHYEKGGVGSYAARLPKNVKAVELLMQKYPGMFTPSSRSNVDAVGEVLIKFHSLSQVERWRAHMRGIKNQTP